MREEEAEDEALQTPQEKEITVSGFMSSFMVLHTYGFQHHDFKHEQEANVNQPGPFNNASFQRRGYIERYFSGYEYIRRLCNCGKPHIIACAMPTLVEEDEPVPEPIEAPMPARFIDEPVLEMS